MTGSSKALKTNCVAKWFCEFGLSGKTLDHSLFGEVRKRIGTKKLSIAIERSFKRTKIYERSICRFSTSKSSIMGRREKRNIGYKTHRSLDFSTAICFESKKVCIGVLP